MGRRPSVGRRRPPLEPDADTFWTATSSWALLPPVSDAVSHYLATGESDCLRYGARVEEMKRADTELRDALVAEVTRRARGKRGPRTPRGFDPVAFTRAKVEPMVSGLFAPRERDIVLAMLERSTVFVTRQNIERLLRAESFLSSAWTLANLYLGTVGAELLSPDAPRLLGFSEHMTCYVSALYFRHDDLFADFVVHEAAHVFHNCKRRTIGLPHTRYKEWLLDIEFRKRETFAYSCEIYACILESAKSPAERRALAAEFAADPWSITDHGLDMQEVARLVVEASRSRNGWKVILRGCAPEKWRPRPLVLA